jgi:hypothetical protein
MFYTYAHYTPQGRLFYIGKGQGKRAQSLKGRNKYWHRVVQKHGKPNVQVLASWKTDEEACSHEILLIECFKDLGYNLCNMTAGGEGTYGVAPWNKGKPWSEEVKLKQGVKNVGNKNWVGRKHSAEAINKQKQAKVKFKFIGTCISTGKTVTILGKGAMKDFGFTSTHVYRCADGKSPSHKGYTWRKELLGATC